MANTNKDALVTFPYTGSLDAQLKHDMLAAHEATMNYTSALSDTEDLAASGQQDTEFVRGSGDAPDRPVKALPLAQIDMDALDAWNSPVTNLFKKSGGDDDATPIIGTVNYGLPMAPKLGDNAEDNRPMARLMRGDFQRNPDDEARANAINAEAERLFGDNNATIAAGDSVLSNAEPLARGMPPHLANKGKAHHPQRHGHRAAGAAHKKHDEKLGGHGRNLPMNLPRTMYKASAFDSFSPLAGNNGGDEYDGQTPVTMEQLVHEAIEREKMQGTPLGDKPLTMTELFQDSLERERASEEEKAMARAAIKSPMQAEPLDANLFQKLWGKVGGPVPKSFYPPSAAEVSDAELPAEVLDAKANLLAALEQDELHEGRVVLGKSMVANGSLWRFKGGRYPNIRVYGVDKGSFYKNDFFDSRSREYKPVQLKADILNPWTGKPMHKLLLEPSDKYRTALAAASVWLVRDLNPRVVLRFDGRTEDKRRAALQFIILVNQEDEETDIKALAESSARSLGPSELKMAAELLAGRPMTKDSRTLVDPVSARDALATAMIYMRTAFPTLEVSNSTLAKPLATTKDMAASDSQVLRQYVASVEQLANASQAAGKLSTCAAAQQRGILLANHLKERIAASGTDAPKVLLNSVVALNHTHAAVAAACTTGPIAHDLWNAPAALRGQPTVLYDKYFGSGANV